MSQSQDTINPNRLPPDIRYRRDATFAALVNVLEAAIRSCDYSPTEIREAAMLAAIRHEQWRSYQIFTGALPQPECTCKNTFRQHDPDCPWYLKREEEELRARMGIQAMGEFSVQAKHPREPEV